MYARHCAWLSATPEKADRPRRESYTEGSPYLELTSLSEYEQHLISLWHAAGTVCQTGMGITALQWSEIVAWANQFYTESYIEFIEHPRVSSRHKLVTTPMLMTQCYIEDYELEIIRELSSEYSSEYSLASDPNRECPRIIWASEMSEEDALANADAIRDALQLLFSK